jgi:ubiquinone biosynthesis protein
VAVKVLRPNIPYLLARDIVTLKIISNIIGIFSSYNKEKLVDIISLLQACKIRELDMMMEASAASDLKEKLSDVKGFYIPKIYWNYTSNKVLTMEWINGIAFSDKKAINASKFNKEEIAQNLVIAYFNQVYIHGFFHADMHPGNLFLMENGDIGVVDFGIVGIIDKKTRIAVAEILISFLKRDYKRVAKLHIDNGLVPANTNLEEFALTCRVIGESIVDVSVKQVSLAKLLAQLIKMTKRYNMSTKPELLLLQKTMMLVEGVGASLDENLNMWELARPWMTEWATKNIGFDAKIRDGLLELFDIIKKTLMRV